MEKKIERQREVKNKEISKHCHWKCQSRKNYYATQATGANVHDLHRKTNHKYSALALTYRHTSVDHRKASVVDWKSEPIALARARW
jgi:hypothetical protein